ncbi:MAG TPA: SPFH domain-containing protein [Planctomycetota bacterium]|nr:SPFH domain-containing protein [Planctomycetota bacterium]
MHILMTLDLNDLKEWLIPAMILLGAGVLLVGIYVITTRYKKFSPNEVGIFYGRKYRYKDSQGHEQMRGFRVVSGGGSLLMPVVEHLQIMSTAAFQSKIDEKGIPNKDNVKINVMGVATCKISSIPEDLQNAAASFLGKQPAEIEGFVKNILMGHLRSIIGKMSIDQILRERDIFNKQVVTESSEELKRLGVQVITLVIQEVNDEYGYIVALGKKAVAEAVRDANIRVAEAEAETAMKVSNAKREASIVAAANAVQVADAEKERDVQQARFKVQAETERAKAEQARAIATADQEKILRQKEAERDAAANEAQIKVQEQEALRKVKELEATMIRPAEAARQKAVIDAEAARQRAVIEADAAKQAAILNADAAKSVAVRRAEGEKEAAVLTGEGEAQKTRATLTALAEGEAAKIRQELLAKAEGEAAMKGLVLEAQAKGTKELALALAQMSKDAKLIMILDRLPALIDHGGEAAARVANAMFSSIAAGLSQIDEIRIIDVGGNGNGIDKMSNVVTQTVFNALAGLKARGINVSDLAKKLGIDISEFRDIFGDKAEEVTTLAPVAPVVEEKKEAGVLKEGAKGK